MPHPGKDKGLKAQIREQLEHGIDPREIADKTDIPLSTVRRWLRNLKRYGQMNEPPQGTPGNQRCLSQEMQTYLLGYLHGRPDAHLAELRRVLREAFDQDVSIPTLSRVLKSRGCMKGHKKKRDTQAALNHGKENAAPPKSSPAVPAAVLFRDLGPGSFAEGYRVGMNWARDSMNLSNLRDSEPNLLNSNISSDTKNPAPATRHQTPYLAPATESHDINT